MSRKVLNLPNGGSFTMLKSDELYIQINQSCNWCYSPDPSAVFPNILAAGSYTATNPPTEYGPYTPAEAGSITFNAVTSGDCTTASPAATPRSITVS